MKVNYPKVDKQSVGLGSILVDTRNGDAYLIIRDAFDNAQQYMAVSIGHGDCYLNGKHNSIDELLEDLIDKSIYVFPASEFELTITQKHSL